MDGWISKWNEESSTLKYGADRNTKIVLILFKGIQEPASSDRFRVKNAGSCRRMLCGIAPSLYYRFIMQRMSSDIKTVDDGNISREMKLSDTQLCHNSCVFGLMLMVNYIFCLFVCGFLPSYVSLIHVILCILSACLE